MYSKKVMEHFRNPHNYEKMKNPDGVGKVGNVVCGDVLHLYLKVEEKNGKETIIDAKFETFGCAAALATSSVITDLAQGKTIEEAIDITKDQVIEELGSLPPVKIHCSLLAVDGLQEAIYNYLSQNNKEIPEKLKQKHKKIEKDRKKIEERYKDLVDLEEDIRKSENK